MQAKAAYNACIATVGYAVGYVGVQQATFATNLALSVDSTNELV